MSNTFTSTRSGKVENESPLQGSESQEVDAFDDVDIAIPAATVWPGMDVGLGAIYAMQAQAILLHSSQDDEALFLGPAYNILATTVYGAGVDATVTFTGDLTEIIYPGDMLLLEGTAANDGVYMVRNEPGAYPARDILSVAFAAGDTTIMIANGQDLAAAAAVGTFRKIMSVQHYNPKYDVAVAVLGPPGSITFVGDLTEQFEAGDWFMIDRSVDTPPGKDGLHQIDTIAYLAPDTTITLAAGVAFMDADNSGEFHRVRLAFELAANTPLLWTKEGGTNNPLQPDTPWTALQGRVDQLRIINAGAVIANFNMRLPRDVNLP